MKINELFLKPIERKIQGVIKIGVSEEENIQQELEEYVVTEELHKHLDHFFTEYNQSLQEPTENIGVWISGFFGSGKSHFLKILSYMLDNRLTVSDQRVPEFFKSKVSKELLEKIEVANQSPSGVILFNIDSKAEADNKQNKTAIVKVFNKVFNEMRGYSPSIPWLAQLEEILEKNQQYEAFKGYFEEESGLSWVDGRDELFYNEDEIICALTKSTQMSEESARRWLENGEANYELSLDSFAKRIKEYIDGKGSDFRLTFFSDEVGQYISDDISLMLNLQSLSEDIGKYTQGKVWIVVTSQQEIDSLKKDGMAAADYSKIQARYSTRLSLSSANADEVIKKRLLEKNQAAKDYLEILYDEKDASLKNAISFAGTATRLTYVDRKDFAEVYPFLPYQFGLLQSAFTEIRSHSAAGKHLSDGERNLLGAFQEAAKQYLDRETNILVSFDMFYDNLDQMLDHSVQSVFIKASRNSNLTTFDLRVLKILFLVRYVASFEKDIESLATLLINEIDQDRIFLQRELSSSLERLQQQYLIQRRGSYYYFLTNEEQDINREIQNIQISTTKQVDEIGRIIYEELLNFKKYTYYPTDENKRVHYNFDVSQWIDNRNRTNIDATIGVRIITCFAEESDAPELTRQLSIRENQVLVVLADQGTYYEDIVNYLKLSEYIRKNASSSQKSAFMNKVQECSELFNSICIQLSTALKEGEYIVHGLVIESGRNPQDNVARSLGAIVKTDYVKLDYVKVHLTTEKDLIRIVENRQGALFAELSDENRLATEEIFRHIELLNQRKFTISLKELLNKFEQKPYGWKEMDVLGSLTRLIMEEKITFAISSKRMKLDKTEEFVRLIMRKSNQEKIVVAKREVIADIFIKQARKLAKELFNISDLGDKEDEIYQSILSKFSNERSKLENLQGHYRYRSYYPGEKEIQEGIKEYQRLLSIDDPLVFFKFLSEHGREIIDTHKLVLPVQQFFSHYQDIFDRAYEISEQYYRDRNVVFSPIVKQSGERIYQIVRVESQPYSFIKELPPLMRDYQNAFTEELENAAQPVLEKHSQSREVLLESLGKSQNYAGIEKMIVSRFAELKNEIEHGKRLSELNALKVEIDDYVEKMIQQINQLRLQEQKEIELKQADTSGKLPIISEAHKKLPIILKRIDILPTGKVTINNMSDIEDYVNQITNSLKREFKDGDTITII